MAEGATHAFDVAPWWGSSVIAGTFVLAGGGLAGVLSFLVARASDVRASKREDRLRWIRDTREAAANFIAECHNLEEAALFLHNAQIRGELMSQSRRAELWERLVTSQSNLLQITSLLSLLAPAEVARQAHEVRTRANELGKECEETEFDYTEIQVEFSEASTDFIMLMREHLGADAAHP